MNRKERVIERLKAEGVKFAEDQPEALGKLAKAMVDVKAVYPDLINAVDCYYIFWMGEQPELDDGTYWYDGIHWCFAEENGTLLRAIGIAMETIEQGREYTLLVLYHELAHLFSGNHKEEFHANLNSFLNHHFCQTGELIRNDLYGLYGEDFSLDIDYRSDSRHDVAAPQRNNSGSTAAYNRMLQRQGIAPKPKRTAAQARSEMIRKQTERNRTTHRQ